MDTSIQAFLVLSLFAAAHERVIEFIRGLLLDGVIGKKFGGSEKWKRTVDVLTICHCSVVPAIVIALATHADALALFHSTDGKNSAFFSLYLSLPPLQWTSAAIQHAAGFSLSASGHLMGCLLMGFAAGLGSKFWHDFAYGLMDLRDRMRSVSKQADAPNQAPVRPIVLDGKK